MNAAPCMTLGDGDPVPENFGKNNGKSQICTFCSILLIAFNDLGGLAEGLWAKTGDGRC